MSGPMNRFRTWLRNWLMAGVEAPAPQAAAAPAPQRKMINIADEVLAGLGSEKASLLGSFVVVKEFTAQEALKPWMPPPGVRPEDAPTLAYDSAPGTGALGAAGIAGWTQGTGFLGYPFLAELTQRPEYRRMSEIIAKEMTRKWVKLKSTGTGKDNKAAKIKRLTKLMEHYRLRDVFRSGTWLDGCFGRGQIYIDTGKTDDPAILKTPLVVSPETVAKGSLKGFRTVEPVWTSPNNYNAADPLNPNYYRPETWFVNGKEIHHTRLLTLVSRPMPDILKPAYNFGGLSMSQMAIPYVNNWLRTRQSVSDITHAFSVPVLMTKLGNLLNLGAAKTLFTRIAFFNRARDNKGAFVIDKTDEDFKIASAPLSSLDKLQAQAQEHMASVSGIPLVVLLGITPSGLNASSDGEIRTFYAWVHAQQEQLFTDPLKTCLEIIQLSEYGEVDDEIAFEFVDLWELDAVAKAALQKTKADTHAIYMADGVVDNEEVREQLANDDDSPYSSLDLSTPAPTPPDMIDPDPKVSGNPAKAESGASGV